MNNKRIIIAAGGTGGHIIPALSIAKELMRQGAQILYVGNKNSMEQKLAEKNNIDFAEINVQKFYRKVTFAHLKFPFKLIKSIIDSKKIIRDFKPEAFLGTGGFVSGPVGYAAHLLKVPIFLQEQNSYPGATTKILSKYAVKIFLGNHAAKKYLPKDNAAFSGNPINQNAVSEKDTINYKKLGLKVDSKKIFLFGGSQGSVVLNNTFLPIIDDLLKSGFEIIWQILGKYITLLIYFNNPCECCKEYCRHDHELFHRRRIDVRKNQKNSFCGNWWNWHEWHCRATAQSRLQGKRL